MVSVPLLISPIFIEFILPFVLVFTLIFAILQKTQLLGEGKKQIDAMVGLVVGLILIAFPFAKDIIVLLMPFLAVSAVILLVFMILYGFIWGRTKGDESFLGNYWKYAFGAVLVVALVSYVIYVAGYWDFVRNWMFGGGTGQWWVNGVLIVAIIGAIVAVIKGEGGSGPSS